MKCTFLANCGLHLEGENSSILIDAPNGTIDGFDSTTTNELCTMAAAEKPYDRLCGIFFTHLHPDHYDKKRLADLLRGHKNAVVFCPGTGDDFGVINTEDFTVR